LTERGLELCGNGSRGKAWREAGGGHLASDASFYTDPDFERNPPARYTRAIERVKADRAPVVIEAARTNGGALSPNRGVK
jgi:hypothetical protein